MHRRGQICRLLLTSKCWKAFSFREVSPPPSYPPTRDSAPGPHWGLCPQTRGFTLPLSSCAPSHPWCPTSSSNLAPVLHNTSVGIQWRKLYGLCFCRRTIAFLQGGRTVAYPTFVDSHYLLYFSIKSSIVSQPHRISLQTFVMAALHCGGLQSWESIWNVPKYST